MSMKLSIDRIYQCKTIDQAMDHLKQDPSAIVLAAGTDIIPALRDRVQEHVRLVDLQGIQGLDLIRLEEGILRIGSMATHQEIADSPVVGDLLPALAQACRLIGSPQIRRRATIGGNICHASPAADTLPVLVAAGAHAVIRSPEGKRTVLLEQFTTGVKKTIIPQAAILEEITIPIPEGGWKGSYYRLGGRNALTISIAAAAVIRDTDEFRVAYGSMAPVVRRIQAVETYLNTCEHADKAVLNDLTTQSLSPISDIRASKEYRTQVAANFTWLGWQELMGV